MSHKRPLSPPPLTVTTKALSPIPQDHSTQNTPLPAFLNSNTLSILHKFGLIRQYERTIRARPGAFAIHPVAHLRDRYPDIKPWAFNSIVLKSLEFGYINASPISLGRENELFIATQGPVAGGDGENEPGDGGEDGDDDEEREKGFEHFWELVWQENSEIVVMLTRPEENGIEKCGVYYPVSVGDKLTLKGWGEVECISCIEESRTEVREFLLRRQLDDGKVEERQVWHFLFLAWPDHGVPKSRADQRALLELIKMSRFRVDDESREHHKDKALPPRVVHCSAGVGRTGTFIALDYLLQVFEAGKWDGLEVSNAGVADKEDDPIFETVKKLRDQRMALVYTPDQYAFIYQVLREVWQAKKKGLGSIENGKKENAEIDDGSSEESPNKKRKVHASLSGGDDESKDDA